MLVLNLSNLEPKRRSRLVNAALKEFATKGFDDASTNVIAKESGISKPLMFHYVNSKKDLFLYLYDYCTELVQKEYLRFMNFNEPDIFERLRQSYVLQIELLQKHPWIFEFIQFTASAKSDEIRKELEQRANVQPSLCYETLFENADESKFREGLDVETCKRLIYWANVGFANQMLDDIRSSKIGQGDYDQMVAQIDGYLNELRKAFYKEQYWE